MKHQFVELNGLTFHLATNGEGPVILFLHGFPEFWYEWRNLLEEFGKDHLAIAPDLRGYNLSEKPARVEDYSVRAIVSDVRAMLDHFSPGQKAVLVGHDWGGAIAWAFAIAFPDYLEKLVIINAPHPGVFARELKSNPAQQKASAYMLMFRGSEAEGLLSANNCRALTRAVFDSSSRPDLFSEEDRQRYIDAWSQPGALTGGLNYYRASQIGPPASAGESPEPFVPRGSLSVTVPTLVIWGEKDTALLPGNLEGLETYVGDLTIRRIPLGTHWVIHEEPALVASYMRQFLGG